MVLEKTILMTESRKISFVAPEDAPPGLVRVICIFGMPGESPVFATETPVVEAKEPEESDTEAKQRRAKLEKLLNWRQPTKEEILAEADQKYKDRWKNGYDEMNRFFGCLQGVYGDGVAYQRMMRDEWPD